MKIRYTNSKQLVWRIFLEETHGKKCGNRNTAI